MILNEKSLLINQLKMSKSKSSKNEIQNFEQLYYSLKDEYEQMQTDNNEIFKEYESTIQMLTDSLNELQNQRNIMNKKLSQMEKEKESLQNRNRDKIIDIQDLNQKNEKLNQEIKKIKEDKKVRDSKIVILENDTEHFQKLIRQDEAVIDELNFKLEEALEENITLQTEFEIYKQIIGEQLLRKDEEIKEIKNDMFSKNLMIKKLKDNVFENIRSPTKERLLHLKNKVWHPINKKDKTKSEINHSATYSRDNNFSISDINKSKLFKNIIINSILNKYIPCSFHTNTKSKNEIKKEPIIPLLSLLPQISNIKLSPDRHKIKCLKSNSMKYSDKIVGPLRTPSNYKNMKIKNFDDYYSRNTSKKNNDNIIKHKQVHKFDIGNIHDNSGEIKNEETTVDLSVAKKDCDNTYTNLQNDFSPNSVSIGKKEQNNNKYFMDDKKIDIAPFKDVFLKKLLNSKKLSNKWEKLMNSNHDYKCQKTICYKKCNDKIEKLGYKIK